MIRLVRYTGARRSLVGAVGTTDDVSATIGAHVVPLGDVTDATVQLWRNGAHVRDVATWADGCSTIARETGGRMVALVDPSPFGLEYATDDDLWELKVV